MLVERTEQRRVETLNGLDPERQASLGQFFTPRAAADLIASMPRLPEEGTLRVLDPGAGVGSLSASLVARALAECPRLSLHVVAVEMDKAVVPALQETMADMAGPRVTTDVVEADFLLDATGAFVAQPFDEPFDLVVMNPPYGKLAAGSTYRRGLKADGVDCPNLYAAFMAVGHRLLRAGGQLVAIVPRSFANGAYFEAFRGDLLANLALDQLHEFGSRSTVFADTGVLQENVILTGTKGGSRDSVVLSLSAGHTDAVEARAVPYDTVVHPGDRHQFIRFPKAQSTSGTGTTLADLGLHVSTGKVVDFRARDYLTTAHADGAVPLIYPGNLRGGEIEWPRKIKKAQGFLTPDAFSQKQLLPEGIYVLIKRFSAKEERRRVVAAVWDGRGPVAIENHLNVIHRHGAGLDRDLAVGLSLWLNSTPLDALFREFSGHTQVNATDLRSLPFPDEATLRTWGRDRTSTLPSQDAIDQIVESAA